MTDGNDPDTLSEDEARAAKDELAKLVTQLHSVVLGQEAAIDNVLIGLLADGHVLLEGVPGVAKTLLARSVAATLGLAFTRVQFTPDLMPADLLGTRVWDQEKRVWELHKGPVFTDVLLADEINRTPPKTQAALLEGMEERQVTLDGDRHDLGDAFFVIATENPLEFEGTYPLPEAQTDRFLLKVRMGYPSEEAEAQLLAGGDRRTSDRVGELEEVLTRERLLQLRDARARVRVDETVRRYVLALLRETREATALKLGASPRAGLMLLSAAQACALLAGRPFALPDDVKAVARPVLRHRLALSTEAELDGLDADAVLDDLLERVAQVR
jgi:MoxR-like ATPase